MGQLAQELHHIVLHHFVATHSLPHQCAVPSCKMDHQKHEAGGGCLRIGEARYDINIKVQDIGQASWPPIWVMTIGVVLGFRARSRAPATLNANPAQVLPVDFCPSFLYLELNFSSRLKQH
jgi:hypothetical protein